MGRASNNSPMRGMSGKLGRIAVFRDVQGETVLANMPKKFKGEVHPKLQATRKKFSKASYYAKRQMLKPDVKAMYAEGINKKKNSPYVVAVSDSLNSPVVETIDTSAYTGAVGQQIIITATDDFRVSRVDVELQDAAGNVIERGQAVSNEEMEFGWEYTTTVANPALTGSKVIASARDFAANTGALTITL